MKALEQMSYRGLFFRVKEESGIFNVDASLRRLRWNVLCCTWVVMRWVRRRTSDLRVDRILFEIDGRKRRTGRKLLLLLEWAKNRLEVAGAKLIDAGVLEGSDLQRWEGEGGRSS